MLIACKDYVAILNINHEILCYYFKSCLSYWQQQKQQKWMQFIEFHAPFHEKFFNVG